MNLFLRKCAALWLAVAVTAAQVLLGGGASAVFAADANAFVITGASGTITEGTDYTYSDGVLTILKKGDYIIKMNETAGITETSTDRIVINPNGDITLTLSDVNITNSSASPMSFTKYSVKLILEGENNIKSTANYCAALSKTNSSYYTLNISGSGSLTAMGGPYAAAIEGSGITVSGGEVNATGGRYGAGIGGGFESSVSGINITGGTVNAEGGTYAAAIGSGFAGSVDTLIISGGYLSLTKASSSAAYIGAGTDGTAKNVSISGGYFAVGSIEDNTVYDVALTDYYYSLYENTDSETSGDYPYYVVLNETVIMGDFEIDGTVAGCTYADNVLTVASEGSYTISMAEGVTSTTTDRIVVSLSGHIKLTISNIDVTSSNNSPLSFVRGSLNLILDGNNTLTSKASGYAGLTTSDYTLLITSVDGSGSGSLNVTGGEYAAGIGGGSGEDGKVIIESGTITAAGGTSAAAIGGGCNGSSSITLRNGYFTLSKGSESADYIGSGEGGSAGSVTIEGGYFAKGSVEDNMVYDTEPDVYYCVAANTDSETAAAYPYVIVDNEAMNYDFTISGDADGYTYENNILTITSGGTYTIGMTKGITSALRDRIVVDASSDVTLTISDLDITCSGNPPFTLEKGSLTLILSGSNSFTGKSNAALYKDNSEYLKITSIDGDGSTTGSLKAAGSGAGIGGGETSNIEIAGGTITAIGNEGSVGIGGGQGGNGSDITISGGTVSAVGGDCSAGIGGGSGGGSGKNITISGGTVSAVGGIYAAAIGGGDYGDGSNITISGGYITLSKTDSDTSSYIGAGDGGSASNISITGGYFGIGSSSANTVYDVTASGTVYDSDDSAVKETYPVYVYSSGAFEITKSNGGTITEGTDYTYTDRVLTVLKGGEYTIKMKSGITETYFDRILVDSNNDVALTIKNINISSYSESPISSDGGNLTLILEGDNYLTSTAEKYAALSKTDSNTLKITSVDGDGYTTGSLTAAGGEGAASIGGDYTVSGNNITIAGGTITAESGQYGAGIGGGRYRGTSNIKITGGVVTASSTDMGAGIGGGQASDGASTADGITITGGVVNASSKRGAAIGGGYGSSGSSAGKNITISGGVVNASSESGAGIGSGANYIKNTSAGTSTESIKITGGTVTASGYSAIGCGSSGGTVTAEAPVISGGSVKTTGGFTTEPVNSDGEDVVLYIVENAAEGSEITINGTTYVSSVVYHSEDDTNQYIYVTKDMVFLFYALGDVDMDGDVDKDDGALLLKHLSEISTISGSQLLLGDLNEDGTADLTDVTAILKSAKS